MVAVDSDGQPVDFDGGFTPHKLLGWFAAARMAMARGQPGVAIGACVRCQAPLVLSSREPLALPCPHCHEPVRGTAEEILVDLWPEPWTKVTGGDLDLEYRLELVDDGLGVTAGCAACGFPTPPHDPSMACRRCGACAWVERPRAPGADGSVPSHARRAQLGVRVNGMRANVPFKVLLPIAQGEMMLRADAARGGAAESGRSALSVTGLGCVVMVAVAVILVVIIAAAVHFAR